MASGVRRAAIIGINEYRDSAITPLQGARNDATEIYDRLSNFGNFRVDDRHLLLDKDATAANVRQAVSDLLWKTDEANLLLVYFSGHGLTDSYGNGFIAPYDMIKEHPIVYGIRMQELRELMLAAKNKQAILTILDCCYSGIAAQGEKAVSEQPSATVDQCLAPLNNSQLGGAGKIILTSAGSDERSHEVTDSQHRLGLLKPHAHGAFTFELLEGLDGSAAGSGSAVTLDSLFKFASTALGANPSHEPKLYGSAASTLDQIFICKASRQEEFDRRLTEIESGLAEGGSLLDLFRAIQRLSSVLTDSPGLDKAVALKQIVDQSLAPLRAPAADLLFAGKLDLSERCEDTYNRLSRLIFQRSISFDAIASEDEGLQNLILCVFQAVEGNAAKGNAEFNLLRQQILIYHGQSRRKPSVSEGPGRAK